ncbi:MAG: hypothetical protein NT011_06195 [Kiritimatiellaeota bacterium]|nr:hypothetical protein [Kiritimatiellota bacterium]
MLPHHLQFCHFFKPAQKIDAFIRPGYWWWIESDIHGKGIKQKRQPPQPSLQEPSQNIASYTGFIPTEYFEKLLWKFKIKAPKGHCLSIKELIFRNGSLSVAESKDNIWFNRDNDQDVNCEFIVINPSHNTLPSKANGQIIIQLPSKRTLKIDKDIYRRINIFSDSSLEVLANNKEIGLLSLMVLLEDQGYVKTTAREKIKKVLKFISERIKTVKKSIKEHEKLDNEANRCISEVTPFSVEDVKKTRLSVFIYAVIYSPDPNDPRYAKFYHDTKGNTTYCFGGPFPLLNDDLVKNGITNKSPENIKNYRSHISFINSTIKDFDAPDYDKRMDNAERLIPYAKEFKQLYPNAKVERHFAFIGAQVVGSPEYCHFLMTVGLYNRYILHMQVEFQVGSDYVTITNVLPPTLRIDAVDRIDVSSNGQAHIFFDQKKYRSFDTNAWVTLKQHAGDLSAIGFEVIKNKPISNFDRAWKKTD